MEYSITGRANSAITSRRMWMLSASRARRCESTRSFTYHFESSKPLPISGTPIGIVGLRCQTVTPIRLRPGDLLEFPKPADK